MHANFGKMPKIRATLKIIFLLSAWSLVLIGLYITLQDYVPVFFSVNVILRNRRDLNTTAKSAEENRTVTNSQLLRDMGPHLPSLPIAYWSADKDEKNASTCGKYPMLSQLIFNNTYWQILHSSNGTFQLFGAYYDIRKNTKGPTVRILGMINRIEPKVKTYCQLWFDGRKEPFISKVFEYNFIWYEDWIYHKGIYEPYLISCRIPKLVLDLVPASVSLVEGQCDAATNNLRVIYNRPPDGRKKEFAVCGKGMDFLDHDLSIRLVEWIELVNILGAEKIILYEFEVHPNITKVLRHYEQIGLVQVPQLTIADDQPNALENEVIPYNDCLYNNLYLYDYVVLLDIDEVIMPKKDDKSWSDLIRRVRSKAEAANPKGFHSYYARNVYFLDDQNNFHGWHEEVPKYMHMLQHIYRSMNYTQPLHYIKSFHDTERVKTLHNHFPISCLENPCRSYPFEIDDAQLQHYRADCVAELRSICNQFRENSVEDKTIWKFKDELIKRSTETLNKLGLL